MGKMPTLSEFAQLPPRGGAKIKIWAAIHPPMMFQATAGPGGL
jgi:hypothetical protein